MTHTPGPWEVGPYGDGEALNVSAESLPHVAYVPGGIPEAEQAANARLIAAAPELLAFAECVVDYCNDPHVVAAAKEAVAKARGQQVPA